MFLVKDWEMFYTFSPDSLGDLVDQVSIDKANQRYVLDLSANELVTDGYDESGEPIESKFVSRLVFDLIVEGLKKRSFHEIVFE